MPLKSLCSIVKVKGSACLMLHLNLCLAAIEIDDLEGLQEYILVKDILQCSCVCVNVCILLMAQIGSKWSGTR